MRPVEYTTEEIVQAGQQLAAAGRNITGFALRKVVGGGTPARLMAVWSEYKNTEAAAVAEPVTELPVEVADAVATIAKQWAEQLAALAVDLNTKAVKSADRRVQDMARSSEELRIHTDRELADASATVDDLEDQLEAARVSNASQLQKLEAQQEANTAQAVELAQVRERLAATEQTAQATAAKHAAELERQHAELVDVRTKAAADLKAANGAAEAARAELASVKAQATAAEKQHAATALQLAQRASDAEKVREEAQKAAAVAREEAARLGGQVGALESQIAALTRTLAGAAPKKVPKNGD